MSASWLVGWSVGWFVDWLVGWLLGQPAGRSVSWLIGWVFDSLVGWLVGWFVVSLIGWLGACPALELPPSNHLPRAHRSGRAARTSLEPSPVRGTQSQDRACPIFCGVGVYFQTTQNERNALISS